MKGFITAAFFIWWPFASAALPTSSPCRNYAKADLVTHYVIPVLETYDHAICNRLEGTCIFKKNGDLWLHNFGKADQPLAQARCKNGYGNKNNCLHPCRVVAASMRHHTYGQIIYMKELVGQRCGNMERDGYEMIHDGFVAVMDTGSPRHFNKTGRFDFFWGRCQNYRNGVCFEGGTQISALTSHGNYCVAWDPKQPTRNTAIKDEFVKVVKGEATLRRDYNAARDFELP